MCEHDVLGIGPFLPLSCGQVLRGWDAAVDEAPHGSTARAQALLHLQDGPPYWVAVARRRGRGPTDRSHLRSARCRGNGWLPARFRRRR